MAFLQQLRTLLWKYTLIRKRAWVRTSLEILLPSLLFIVSLIIKAAVNKPVINKPTCYGADRVMPSAGFPLFARSLFCDMDTFNEKCENRKSDFKFANPYNESILSDMYGELTKSIGKHSTKLHVDTIKKAYTDIKVLREISERYRNGQTIKGRTKSILN